MMVSSIAVYGAANTIASTHIVYDNTNSNLRADNVQDAVDELYSHATDYTEIKSYFKNNPTSYFNGDYLHIGINNNTSNNNNKLIDFYHNGYERGALYYQTSGDKMILSSNDSTGTWGNGTLDLRGNPVTVNGSNIQKEIKYKNVKIDSVTIPGNGYLDISSYKPAGMNNFLFASVWDFGVFVSDKSDFDVTASGLYLKGSANLQISYVTIRYFYYD